MADKFINISNSSINNRSVINSDENKTNSNLPTSGVFREQLTKLISDNKLPECLNLISDYIIQINNSGIKHEFIHVSSQYHRIKEERRLNILSHDEYSQTMNKITNSILEYIDKYI